jgi:hypothetical protein
VHLQNGEQRRHWNQKLLKEYFMFCIEKLKYTLEVKASIVDFLAQIPSCILITVYTVCQLMRVVKRLHILHLLLYINIHMYIYKKTDIHVYRPFKYTYVYRDG